MAEKRDGEFVRYRMMQPRDPRPWNEARRTLERFQLDRALLGSMDSLLEPGEMRAALDAHEAKLTQQLHALLGLPAPSAPPTVSASPGACAGATERKDA